jgi:hypothetical protein
MTTQYKLLVTFQQNNHQKYIASTQVIQMSAFHSLIIRITEYEPL